jgi:endoglucanase
MQRISNVLCLFFFILFRCLLVNGACTNLDVTSEWGDGLSADFHAAVDHQGHGWEMLLTFDNTLSSIECWQATVTTTDSKTFKFANSDEDISSGGTIELHLLLHFSTKPQLIAAYLDGSDVCGGGSANPTTTTTTTTTTTPTGPPTTTTPCLPPCTTTTTLSTTTVDAGYKPDHPAKYDYGSVIEKSLLFFEAQRSGPLPDDNRVPWRADSAMGDEVLGGYYDAGDLVKFGFPMANTIAILAWGGFNFQGGYEAAGQKEWLSKCIKWGSDYFIGCHTAEYELIGQIGDGYDDHAYWGRPEDMTMARPAFKITSSAPGSDLAGETAAALAASAIYFRNQLDYAYAENCLNHAKQLLDFADKYRGKYTDAIPAGGFYESWSGYNDELVWAAAWVAKATGDQADIDKAESLYTEMDAGNANPSEISWDDKWAMTFLMMYDITGKDIYKAKVDAFMNYILSAPRTPKGLVWIPSSEWGSLRYAGNFAMWAMQAGRLGIMSQEAFDFAESQMNYILGDGAGHSYVVGWGNDPPQKPHHRAASCPDRPAKCDWDNYQSQDPNPQVLNGALVGGPNQNDVWWDDRTNFQVIFDIMLQ